MKTYKKILVGSVFLLVSLLVTFLEIHWIESRKESDLTEIVIAKRDLGANVILQASDLESMSIASKSASEQYIKNFEAVIGRPLIVSIHKGTAITTELLLNKPKIEKKEDTSTTTLKLAPEEALAWQIEVGEQVEIAYINEETKQFDLLGSVTIEGIFDHLVKENAMPTYLLISGETAVIHKIISTRAYGKFEILK